MRPRYKDSQINSLDYFKLTKGFQKFVVFFVLPSVVVVKAHDFPVKESSKYVWREAIPDMNKINLGFTGLLILGLFLTNIASQA